MSGQHGYELQSQDPFRDPLLAQPPYRPVLSIQEYLSEVSTIRTQLSQFRENVSSISRLHDASLHSHDDNESYRSEGGGGSSAQLESLIAATSGLTKQLRDEIKALERDTLGTTDYHEKNTKSGHAEKLKADFDRELHAYQQVEQQFRAKYREQLTRQYKIVNPAATPTELETFVSSGETQIFSQALLSSGRQREATSALASAKSRQAEIARIESTIIELAALFEEMAQQVELAEPMVEQIEDNLVHTKENVEAASKELGTAVVHGQSRRRKKWYLLGVCVLIVVVIAAGVGISIAMKNGGNSNSNKPAPAPAQTT